jgi:hypothetical protein
VTTRSELEITPEPTPEERAAIETAVEELLAGRRGNPAPGAWWQAGILEAIEEADEV